MPDQLLTPAEFAQTIKAKYPDYASVPDGELAARMLEKYPEYKSRVRMADFSTTNQKDASGKATAVDWNPLSSANVNAAYQRSGIQGLVELGKRSVNVLPAIGGAAGGVVGGLGGSVAGVGVGGVPGAIGGAALGGAAGEAAKQLINRARGGEAPATSGAAAASIGTQAAVHGTAEAVGAGLGAGMKAAAPWLMQKALKPTASLASEYRTTAPKLVQTLLDEGISVTQTGVDKLQRLLDATNAKIREAVANATGSIQKNTVAARALETAAKVSKQVNPAADLQAVGDTVEQFVNHPVFTGKLSIPEAQAMKQGTYQQIGKKYGEVSSASIETQKALARGLKEEIAAEVPGLAGLNSRDSELMAALDATGRRVALSGNKDPVGFAWVAQHPTTFLAAIFDRSPAVKSFVARGLYSSAGSAAKVAPQLIRAAVVALSSHGSDVSPLQD